jgi:hypothetical protein
MDYNSQRSNLKIDKLILPIGYLIPKDVTKVLSITIIVLLFFNLLEKKVIDGLNILTNLQLSPHHFALEQEGTFISLYSGLTLGFCSLLLALIAYIKKTRGSRFAKSWQALSYIFLYLAFDELCGIHEILIPILKTFVDAKGFIFYPWVIVGSISVIVFLIAFRDFIFNLPPKIRTLFLIAGAIFVGGALGMEIIGGYLGDVMGFSSKAFWLVSTLEEVLEMFGIVIFIHALLSYIKHYLAEFNYSISFEKTN